MNELVILVVGGALMAMSDSFRKRAPPATGMLLELSPLAIGSVGTAAVAFSPSTLFLVFLKIGAILFGSGYVLLAFLRADLRRGCTG